MTDNGNTTRVFISGDTADPTYFNGGNVGIGTASPNEKLEIYGNGIRIHDPSSIPKLDFVRGGTSRSPNTQTFGLSNYSDWRITTTGMNLSFQNRWTGGNSGNLLTAMTLAHSNGNVGIGETSPAYSLSVDSRHGLQADGVWARYRVGTGQSNDWRLYFRTQSGNSDAVKIIVNQLLSANDASDDRIKTDEVLVENATQTLLKLKPQTYTKDIFEFDELTSEEYSNTATTDGYVFSPTHDRWRKRRFAGRPQKETGLIIQDIWYDAPELRHIIHLADDAEPAEERPNIEDIQQDPDYDALGWGLDASQLKYQQLIPYLIKSNQEIYTELQTEKAKVADLLARVEALENA